MKAVLLFPIPKPRRVLSTSMISRSAGRGLSNARTSAASEAAIGTLRRVPICRRLVGMWVSGFALFLASSICGLAQAEDAAPDLDQLQRQVDSAKAAKASEAAKARQEAAKRQLATGSGSLDVMVEKLLIADSQTWFLNRYVTGSARNSKITAQSGNGVSTTIRSDYRFNGDQTGWVEVTLENQKVTCLRYWDFPERCKTLGGPNPLLQ